MSYGFCYVIVFVSAAVSYTLAVYFLVIFFLKTNTLLYAKCESQKNNDENSQCRTL